MSKLRPAGQTLTRLALSLTLLLGACGGATDAPAPRPAAMLKIGGDGQRGAAGEPLPVPLVVQVEDGSGRPARGAAVAWTVTAGGGRVEPEAPVAGADGRVAARWVLGTGVGANEVVARAEGGEPARFAAVAVAGAPSTVSKVAGDAQAGRAGAPLDIQPEVRVADAHGNPVAGATVQWSASSGGSASPAVSTTDDAGRARTRWMLAGAVSAQQLTAAVAGVPPAVFQSTAAPSVLSIAPGAVGAGDTLLLRGFGLAGAAVEIGDAPAAVLAASDTLLRVLASTSLPPCAEVHPRLGVRVGVPGARIDTTLESLGAPLAGPASIGRHLILPSVGHAGCRVVLEPGTYGLAVYRTSPPTPSATTDYPPAYDSTRIGATLSIRPSGSFGPTARQRPVTRLGSALRSEATGRAPDVLVPASTASPHGVCSRPAGAVGDTMRLIDQSPLSDIGPGGTSVYRIRYVTPHFNWLFRDKDTASIPSYIAVQLPALIARAEASLYPILERTFGPLPDFDSNGRLNVVVAPMRFAGGFYGGTELYADGGCPSGDFVWLAPDQITWTALAHEATHWIDISTRPGRDLKGWWSVEGIALLGEYYTRFEDMHQQLWGANTSSWVPWDPAFNHGGWNACAPGNGEYWPDPAYTYGAGCAMLRHLVDQALVPGRSPAELMRKLLDRSTRGDLRPVFLQLGGDDRSEEELEGEYLLSFYADDYIPGISPRLVNRSFDVRAGYAGLPYEFPKLTVHPTTAQTIEIPLRTPDGIVVELEVDETSIVTLGPADPRLSLAVVRRR